jgi:hypothetical protein
MELGPRIDISPEVGHRIAERISDALEKEVLLDTVHRAPGGANANTHRVIVTEDGRWFSLKKSARVAHGDKKVRLISQLAQLVQVPNHCLATRVAPIEGFEPFHEGDMNVTEWLAPHALTLNEAVDRAKTESKMFFSCYGEQALFCLVFGIADRGTQNWVWDPATDRLTFIDEEDAFSTSQIAEYVWAFVGIADRTSWKQDPESYAPALKFRGAMKHMHEKLAGSRPQWRELLNANVFAAGRLAAANEIVEKSFEEIYQLFIGAF